MPGIKITAAERDELHTLVAAISLAAVIEELSDIAFVIAEQLVEEDAPIRIVRKWERAAEYLEKVSSAPAIEQVS